MAAMSEFELYRLAAAEKDALQRYSRIKNNFVRDSEILEHARLIWAEASAALLSYQERRGG
jgi:hypothetical protein